MECQASIHLAEPGKSYNRMAARRATADQLSDLSGISLSSQHHSRTMSAPQHFGGCGAVEQAWFAQHEVDDDLSWPCERGRNLISRQDQRERSLPPRQHHI